MEAIEILKNARVADPKNPQVGECCIASVAFLLLTISLKQLHFQYAHVLLTNGSRSLLKEAFAALQVETLLFIYTVRVCVTRICFPDGQGICPQGTRSVCNDGASPSQAWSESGSVETFQYCNRFGS